MEYALYVERSQLAVAMAVLAVLTAALYLRQKRSQEQQHAESAPNVDEQEQPQQVKDSTELT
eukprot:2009067-Prymnesium_polylepis.1